MSRSEDPPIHIRSERPADRYGVHAIHAAAFETEAEADLVDTLREAASPIVSLVATAGAVDGETLVGHILFTPVTLRSQPEIRLMGLAPMAVSPEQQRGGVGSALVRAGLDACRDLGAVGAVVLGHPDYYPRFGFEPSTRFGIVSEYDVPEEVFMAMELRDGGLEGRRGTVRYHAAFGGL